MKHIKKFNESIIGDDMYQDIEDIFIDLRDDNFECIISREDNEIIIRIMKNAYRDVKFNTNEISTYIKRCVECVKYYTTSQKITISYLKNQRESLVLVDFLPEDKMITYIRMDIKLKEDITNKKNNTNLFKDFFKFKKRNKNITESSI